MELLALCLGVLGASLVGSLHCAGMCGGLMLAAVADGGKVGARRGHGRGHMRAQGAYHLARGVSYAALGALAAGVGALVDLAGLLAGVASAAAWGAAFVLLVLLVGSMWPGLRAGLGRSRIGLAMGARVRAVQVRALRAPRELRGLALGSLSSLMPCGWLYAFAVVAAGTARPLAGAAVMLAFWIGTVPILSALGFGAQRALGPLLRRVPAWTPVLALLIAFAALSGRFGLDAAELAQRVSSAADAPLALPDPAATPACCEGEADAGG